MIGSIKNCHNVEDFRRLAKRRLPGPIFHYIDGAADDEITYRRNTESFNKCDLIPNVLSGVDKIDMSTTVMGQKLDMPLYCAPTALQRLFHHDGEVAVAKAAEKHGTLFGISSLGTAGIEEISIEEAGIGLNDVLNRKIARQYIDQELNEARENIFKNEDETLTWRIDQANEFLNKAISGIDNNNNEEQNKLNDDLNSINDLIKDKIWIKKNT